MGKASVKEAAGTCKATKHRPTHKSPEQLQSKQAEPATSNQQHKVQHQQASGPEQKHPHDGKKRAKDEINDIFGSKKKQKPATVEQSANAGDPQVSDVAAHVKQAREAKLSKLEGSKDDIFGEEATKARKRTEEGYTIYSETELGLGKKGGDTDLCPFDCDCCF
eukprot:jgi/Chrzof1/5727/Cz16g13080.t1